MGPELRAEGGKKASIERGTSLETKSRGKDNQGGKKGTGESHLLERGTSLETKSRGKDIEGGKKSLSTAESLSLERGASLEGKAKEKGLNKLCRTQTCGTSLNQTAVPA